MSISTTVRNVLALACVSALPLYGQTTQTTDTAAHHRPVAKKSETTSQTASTSTEKKATTPEAGKRAATGSRSRLWTDAARLSAILIDTQDQKATLSADAWKKVANEANSLANRIAANAGGQKAARELRTHIREMHGEAMKGNADGARSHAAMALPYAYQLMDWAGPKTK